MSKALEALLDYQQSDADGVAVEVSRQAVHEVADEVARLEDRVATFLQETEGLREVIITKHEQIACLEASNARLSVLLMELYALVKGECPSLLNEDSGGNAKLSLEIVEAVAAEEKEQSK